jgi:hypothetical protein
MRCTYLIVVPWPVPRPFYAATQTHLLAVVAPPAPASTPRFQNARSVTRRLRVAATSKGATLQGGSSRNRCWAERTFWVLVVVVVVVTSYRFLAQSSFRINLNLREQFRIYPKEI